MGVACKIFRTPDGAIEKVEAPNGEPSRLYRDAAAVVGDAERALGVWATAYTSGFQDYYGYWEDPQPSDTFNLDENGEPYAYDVIKYYERENSVVGSFAAEEVNDIRSAIQTMNVKDIETLAGRFTSSFMIGGEITINETTLRNSGLYATDEINRILRNPGLIEGIKSEMERVIDFVDHNNDPEKSAFYFSNPDINFIVYKAGSYNSLGKQNIYNPGEIDMEMQEAFGGVRDEIAMDEAISQISNPALVDKLETDGIFRDEAFNVYSDMLSVPEATFAGNEVVESNEHVRNASWYFSPSVETSGKVHRRIARLVSMTEGTWFNNLSDVQKDLREIEKDMADMNIDVVGLSSLSLSYNNAQAALLASSAILTNLEVGNREAAGEAVRELNSLLNRNGNEVVDLGSEYRSLNPMKIYGSSNANQAFRDFGLIRLAKDVYFKVSNDMTVDEMYDEIASMYYANKGWVPMLHNMPAHLQEASSEEEMRDNIRKYVRSISDYYNTEEMVLNRLIFNLPLRYTESYDEQTEFNKYMRREELGRDFDFGKVYHTYLRHKVAKDDLWENAYQYLRFTPTGIETRTEHDSALKSIGINLKGENRSDLEKALLASPNSLYERIFFNNNSDLKLAVFDFRSYFCLRNKEMVKEMTTNSSLSENGMIEVPGSYDEFLRRGDDVYSKISEDGNKSLFSYITFDGADNIRRFTQTSHLKSTEGFRSDPVSLIKDDSGLSASERKDLDSRLEC